MHHRRKTLAAGVATGQRDRLHWRAAERTRPSETGTPLAALTRKISLQRWAMPPRCLPVGADTAYQPRRVESGAGTALCTKAPRTHTAAAAPSFGEAQPARGLQAARRSDPPRSLSDALSQGTKRLESTRRRGYCRGTASFLD